MWLLVFLQTISVADFPSREDIESALKFQYEQKLSRLVEQNAQLQARVNEQKQQILVCADKNRELRVSLHDIEKKFATQTETELSEYAVDTPMVDNDKDIYQQAMEAVQNEQYNQATLLLEGLVQGFPKSELADNSLFMMGEIYMHRKEFKLAEVEFLRLLQMFPKSERRNDAIAQIKQIDKEFSSQKPTGPEDNP